MICPAEITAFRDAAETVSMTSQRTGSSGLSRFAFPYQRCPFSSCTASLVKVRNSLRDIARRYRHHQLAAFPLGALEVGAAVEAEQRVDRFVRHVVEHQRRPAERGRRDAHRADGVAGVVLAVAEGALAVLPGLAPVDRRETHQERLRANPTHQSLE